MPSTANSCPPTAVLLHPQYRPDIDGLRAIAVLAVVFFHAFRTHSGFIGVDIFFVISGFLITTIILGSFEGEGFSYRTFYARRIRRIFPALLLVMGVTLAAGWFLLLPGEWVQLGRHLVGGAGFASNFVLWHEAGYFDNASETKLLLHLWSLAIEEQFYILWPVLLGLTWWRKWPVLPILVGMTLLSFGVNVALVAEHREAAFYAPWARAWELMAGGILACLRLHTQKPWLPWSPGVRAHVQSTAGVVLIALGLHFTRANFAFPGWWALLPVLGTALSIAAGPGGWFNRVLLAWRPLVWIGLISYPLYLWHWPLLAFARTLANETPSGGVRVGVVLASFVLAWLTYRLLERRVRTSLGTRPLVALGAVMATLGGVGLLMAGGEWRGRHDDPCFDVVMQATSDWGYPGTFTRIMLDSREVYRAGNGKRKVLLIGDSHMTQQGPRLQALLEHDPALPVTLDFMVRGGCPPILNVVDGKFERQCTESNEAAIRRANTAEYDVIVLGAAWDMYFSVAANSRFAYNKNDNRIALGSPDGIDAALGKLQEQISNWVRQGKQVYLLLDNPGGPSFAPGQIIQGQRWGRMSVAQWTSATAPWPVEQVRLHERMRDLALRNGAQILDPIPVLCSDGQCIRALPDGTPVYLDGDHLRASYVREHAIWMDVLVAP